mmetsp:Transcript_1286/g.3779  ORF Transcript_1286/g.3779 Transcript_1286/m.3779 type:complete len:200 (-) Transcript_1286:3-602(-)
MTSSPSLLSARPEAKVGLATEASVFASDLARVRGVAGELGPNAPIALEVMPVRLGEPGDRGERKFKARGDRGDRGGDCAICGLCGLLLKNRRGDESTGEASAAVASSGSSCPASYSRTRVSTRACVVGCARNVKRSSSSLSLAQGAESIMASSGATAAASARRARVGLYGTVSSMSSVMAVHHCKAQSSVRPGWLLRRA